jgi:hypothetical protein
MISVMEVMSETCEPREQLDGKVLEEQLPEIYAFADETCRGVAETMATKGVASMPVVDRSTRAVCGQVTVQDLLAGRRRSVQREQDRVGVFGTSR